MIFHRGQKRIKDKLQCLSIRGWVNWLVGWSVTNAFVWQSTQCTDCPTLPFLAADTQLIKGFVRPSVCWSPAWVDKWGNKCFLIFFAHVWVCSGVGVWMGAGRPCPPVRPVCCSVSLLFNPLGRNDWVKKCKDEHFPPAWVYGSGRGCERRLYACQPIHSDIVTLQYLFKQVTWGHNTAQTHTQIITIAASKMRVFVLFNSIIMD